MSPRPHLKKLVASVVQEAVRDRLSRRTPNRIYENTDIDGPIDVSFINDKECVIRIPTPFNGVHYYKVKVSEMQ